MNILLIFTLDKNKRENNLTLATILTQALKGLTNCTA